MAQAWGQLGRDNGKIFSFRMRRSGDGAEVYEAPFFCIRSRSTGVLDCADFVQVGESGLAEEFPGSHAGLEKRTGKSACATWLARDCSFHG